MQLLLFFDELITLSNTAFLVLIGTCGVINQIIHEIIIARWHKLYKID